MTREPCTHSGAVPVTLTTGETIAALCPACDTRLTAAWLTCDHPAPIDITMISDPPGTRYICSGCDNVFGRPVDPTVAEVWT